MLCGARFETGQGLARNSIPPGMSSAKVSTSTTAVRLLATWAASPEPKTGAPRLDLLSLARQTGHKNLKMLQRYYRPKSEDIVKRLDSMVEG